jgi:hypothetical protein
VNNSLKSEITYKYLIAACLASLVISTFASYFFYDRWSDAEDRYVTSMNEKNQLTQNYHDLKSSHDKLFNALLIMRDENAKVTMLQSADTAKHYLAHVYWNGATHETFIDVISLPAADSIKEYQLWAMVGGHAINAGVFNCQVAGIQQVKSVMNADSWVVTLEPKGGSASPTPDQVYLLSKF